MKFGCLSCGAKYSVPDGRLKTAGAAGLRIRCTRCRAIMVVSEAHGAMFEDRRKKRGDDEDTLKMRPAGLERRAPDHDGLAGVPAALSASGVYRPLPGVHRQVTGLFFPEMEAAKDAAGDKKAARLWYAAIDGRPRGPFAASEMIMLAEKGKLRDSTNVWRPGFERWLKVKHGGDELSWLRDVVMERKQRERAAQERAQQLFGIPAVNLTRTSSGPRPAKYDGGGAGMPPPLPFDALDDDKLGVGLADLLEPAPLTTTVVLKNRAAWPWVIAAMAATSVLIAATSVELARSGLLERVLVALFAA